MTNNRQSAILFVCIISAHLCSGLAQTALQLFSKMSKSHLCGNIMKSVDGR